MIDDALAERQRIVDFIERAAEKLRNTRDEFGANSVIDLCASAALRAMATALRMGAHEA